MWHRTVLASLALSIAFASSASAHIKITSPPPRYDNDSIKEGGAPCGGPRSNTPLQLMGGEQFELAWEETVYHTGYFTIRFSEANDENFQTLEGMDKLYDGHPNLGQGNNVYSETITAPNIDCDTCTYQLIQYMAGSMTNYYSCVDVQITAVGGEDAGMDAGGDDVGVPDAGMDAATPGMDSGSSGTGADSDATTPPTMGGDDVGTPVYGDASMELRNIDGTGRACATRQSPAAPTPLVLLLAALVLTARGRRARGRTSAR